MHNQKEITFTHMNLALSRRPSPSIRGEKIFAMTFWNHNVYMQNIRFLALTETKRA